MQQTSCVTFKDNELHKLLPQINEAASNCQADLIFLDCYYCNRVVVACLNNEYCNSAK